MHFSCTTAHQMEFNLPTPFLNPHNYLPKFFVDKTFPVSILICILICAHLFRESDEMDEDGSSSRSGKRQLKLSNVGFTSSKRRSEEIESSGKGRCKFFEARKLQQLTHF